MSLIQCNHLSFAYDGIFAAKDLNFTVNSGDYLCIVGENGAGKSTLMKGLLRLKKPASGSIVYSDGLTAQQIGYLPQQTAVQKDFPASVYEVVLSGCLNQLGILPFYGKAQKHRRPLRRAPNRSWSAVRPRRSAALPGTALCPLSACPGPARQWSGSQRRGRCWRLCPPCARPG